MNPSNEYPLTYWRSILWIETTLISRMAQAELTSNSVEEKETLHLFLIFQHLKTFLVWIGDSTSTLPKETEGWMRVYGCEIRLFLLNAWKEQMPQAELLWETLHRTYSTIGLPDLYGADQSLASTS